jgi:sirohydrochlorin ferrochelatase
MLGRTYPSTYAGGTAVQFGLAGDTALDYATLSTASAFAYSGYDLAFGATFSEPNAVVPEPAAPAAVLTLILCAGLFVLRLRQRRHTARLPATTAGAPLSLP